MLHCYGKMREHFNGPHRFEKQIALLKEENEVEAVQRRLAEHKLLEFQMEVAAVLPGFLKGKEDKAEGYPMRGLASVVSKGQNETLQTQLAKMKFAQAKEKFRKHEFSKAVELFQEFVSRYSYSSHLTEAYFLMAESQFQLQEFDACTKTVEHMLQVFPESELTGYALLRLGKIYEYRDRPEEAAELYKTVLRSFPHRGLASQAKLSLGAVEL